MASPLNAVPLPLGDPISRPRARFRGRSLQELIQYLASQDSEGYVGDRWSEYLTQNVSDIQAAPRQVGAVLLTDQAASIGATDISDGSRPAGAYRLTWHATIVRGATTSSSLTVTLDWTYRGGVKSKSYPAITGNTIATADHGGGLIYIDSASPVRYSVTYGSVGATTMLFDCLFVLDRVNA